MTAAFLLQLGVLLAGSLLVAGPLGLYLARVFDGPATGVDRWLLRLVGVGDDPPGMDWRGYATAMLGSNLFMALLVYAILVGQGHLPWNPQGFAGMEPLQAFNTAASFVTNTDWQSYAGETTLSPFAQMAAIGFPMFTSAATGFCVAIAFIRGLAGRPDMGHFHVDMIRFLTRVMLPVCVVAALFFVWQGVPQTLSASQAVPVGPVASLDAVKHFGTNGGGYYGQNSAHPLENPTPLACAVQIWLMMALPMALVVAFGKLAGAPRQALAIFAGMGLLVLGSLGLVSWAETAGTPLLPGGSLEGKEVRFGQALTAAFVAVTTAMTTGSVNAMHDSLTPLGGLAPLAAMMLNCAFGGKGVGFMTFVLYGLLAAFLTGLMVGRTPEFMGKKLEAREIRLAAIAILVHPLIILVPTAIALSFPFGLTSLANAGPHGLTEVLYAYTSGAANNGSAFAGLNANTPWYNASIGVVMLIGRYVSIVALLAIAGSLAAKRPVPAGPGTLRTDTPLFMGVWLATIAIVGALTFFPVVALGPIAEHLAMQAGQRF